MGSVVQVSIKNVYGNSLIYPMNDAARTFAELVKKKTFDKYDIRRIKDLGFTVEVITETL